MNAKKTTIEKKTGPWADTRLARFIDKRITELSSIKSQKDIAAEVGYTTANLVSMIKAGVAKLPLDRVPAMAKSLDVDPAHLFMLAVEQQFDDGTATAINQIFGMVLTENEKDLMIAVREKTGDSDPSFSPEKLKKIQDVIMES